MTFGRVGAGDATQAFAVPPQRPFAGHAMPPGHTAGCVGQHGGLPGWCVGE